MNKSPTIYVSMNAINLNTISIAKTIQLEFE